MATHNEYVDDPRVREAALTIPVYGQLPFVPERASGCDIFTRMAGVSWISMAGMPLPRSVTAIRDSCRPSTSKAASSCSRAMPSRSMSAPMRPSS